jgi:hypothetical protein
VSSQYPPGNVPSWQPRPVSQRGQQPLRQTERPAQEPFDAFARRPSGQEPSGREPSGREPSGQEPSGQQPGGRDRRKQRRRWPALVRWPIAVVLVLFAVICVAGGIAVTGQANSTSASNAAQANSAAATTTADDRWATTPVTTIFPATIAAANSKIPWERVAVDSSTSCSAALMPSWQPDSTQPCTALLRATYVDEAHSIAATVGIIVNPSSTDPAGANVDTAWLIPMSTAADQSEEPGAANTASVNFPIHAFAAPGTAAADFGDSDLMAMTAGTWLKGAPSDWLGLVVETGSIDGQQRAAGDLPAPWGSQQGGDLRDRDSWLLPSQDLTTALDDYYQKLFG